MNLVVRKTINYGTLLEDEVNIQVAGQVVDCQVLPVQAHVGEEVQLVAVVLHNGRVLGEQVGVGPGTICARGDWPAGLRRRLGDLIS